MSNANEIFGEMNFDSSLYNNMDSQITSNEFRDRVFQLLQPILDERFPSNYQKRKIAPHSDRISFACPYCGDSMKLSNAKRGNFILKGKHAGFFKCHNCSEFKRIDAFFKDYNISLKLDTINYLMDNLGNFNDNTSSSKYDMSVFIDMENLDKYAIDRTEFSKHYGLVEVKNTPVWSWLTNRLQFNQDKFLYNPNENYLFILNLTKTGKILGAQKRLFKGDNRFLTYKLSKLYSEMNRVFDIKEDNLSYIDDISTIFNICLINFNLDISLFEGPMDSFLFKNSIANTGANKTLPIEIPIRYFYDSDETGIKRSLEHINRNESVFLWAKLIKDMELPYRKKWDLNDLYIYTKEHNIKIPMLNNYFSSDPLDALDI